MDTITKDAVNQLVADSMPALIALQQLRDALTDDQFDEMLDSNVNLDHAICGLTDLEDYVENHHHI